jgi:tripartite-type tricarboxylate transporter receptor subunit TctC
MMRFHTLSYRGLRELLVRVLLLLTLMPLLAPPSSAAEGAADWPNRPLKLIVPFPPGGAADLIGRYYAEQLSMVLGQRVLVDNRPGAGTAIAAEVAARAAPDGYTLSLATSGQLTILPNLQQDLRFDPIKDFTPVSLLGSVPNVVAVNRAKSGIGSLDDLLRLARAQPGQLSLSSCGKGTLCHLSGALLQNLTATTLLHVPYKGSAPAVAALLAGEVDVSVDTLTILSPQIKAGKLQGLLLGSAQRSPLLPEVPSADEVGLPGFVANGWFGLVLPAGAPAQLVQQLHQAIVKIAVSPETARHFAENGITPEHSSPSAYAQRIEADLARWRALVVASKVAEQ